MLLRDVIIVVLLASPCVAFLLDNTCVGRCGAGNDRTKSCQCNSACTRYHDCCDDYQHECNGAPLHQCQTTSQVAQALWDNDVNRLSQSQLTINTQGHLSDHSNTDRASQSLVTYIDKTALTYPTYTTFVTLLDNYAPDKGSPEVVTSQESSEVKDFMDAILNTSVMQTLLAYLKCKGTVHSETEFRQRLTQMWFDLYPRSSSSNVKDTSGFEHVMIGEYKTSSQVNGFHNWISFYLKEAQGSLNYNGYVTRKYINHSLAMLGAAFDWDNRHKSLGSFFVGVSPEFDMAIYSLCFLDYPGKSCPFTIDGTSLRIQSYSTSGHISTAYVS